MNDALTNKFSKIQIKDIDSQTNVSQLTISIGGNDNITNKRRSSVLRRMSIGFPQNGSTATRMTLDAVNKNGLTDNEDDDDDKDDDNDDDDDDVLYRRSNSTTHVQIEDFEKLCVLGQGAYGKVLLVKNHHSNKLYAQKELKKASILVNNKSIERTISERTILSKITRHQNIVKLFYALHDESKLYLLMEFIPGGELFQYIAKEKFLNEKQSAFYIAQMAMALRYLHSCGIIYRDLKPENCMLDKDGYLVLTDFGLAKQAVDDDPNDNWCNSIIGTPEYCAPEVLKGLDYGFKADWWSLGCVMFDLLTGDPPFTGNNHNSIIKKALKNKPKYPFHVMSDSKQLINKLLEKQVEKRFDVDLEWNTFQKFGFFKYYKFKDIENRTIEPPILPSITNLETAECFDSEFTKMKLSSLNIDIKKEQMLNPDVFNGFSFTAGGSYMNDRT